MRTWRITSAPSAFSSRVPKRPPVAVVNVDDQFGRRLADEIASDYGDGLVTFSAAGSEAVLSASDVEFDAGGSRFVARGAIRRGEGGDAAPR